MVKGIVEYDFKSTNIILSILTYDSVIKHKSC